METSFSNHSHGKPLKKSRQKKLSTHIDMTPMVDMAFLLVTFFILTTSMAKPKAMQIVMPEEGNGTTCRDSETLNLLIGKQEVVVYFGNDLASHQIIEWPAVRNFLVESNQRVRDLQQAKGWKENGVMVLIKPMSNSKYGDLVNMLDEMKIAQITTYAIVDAAPEEMVAMEE